MEKLNVSACRKAALFAAAAVGLAAGPGQACDIPVYRFALDFWERQPYQVVYFYRGRPAQADADANAALKRLSDGEGAKVNLEFRAVDVEKIFELPDDALEREIWKRQGADALPLHVVVTPREEVLFAGRLTPADVRAMAASPRKVELVRLLGEGKMMLLLLTGPDEAANVRAERLLTRAVAAAKQRRRDVVALTVRRDEVGERWLVRQLLAIEPDLGDIRQPMVFAAFGRGRFLEPWVGKDISPDNLEGMIEFMNGPCSCIVQTSGVGMDLLTDFDWDSCISGELPPAEQPVESVLVEIDGGAAPAAQAQPLAAASNPALLRNALLVLAGLAVVAAVGGWLMPRRRRAA